MIYIITLLLTIILCLIISLIEKDYELSEYKEYLNRSLKILQKTEDITNRLDEIEMRNNDESNY